MHQRVPARAQRRLGRDLARTADDGGPLGAACPQLDLGGEHSEQPGDVAPAARHYDERQLEALVLMVAITNFFNRINTTFRVPAGTRWD
jgi:hypothetical protein